MRHPPQKELVWVEWKDAWGASDREHIDSPSPLKLATMFNLGWIVEQNDEAVKVAHGYSNDTEQLDVTIIPRPLIVSITPVRKPRRKKNEEANQRTV